VKIKKAAEEDLKDILELQKLAYKSEAEIYGDFSVQPLRQTMEEITEEFKNYVFIKMINDEEKIIGSVRGKCVGETCFIGKLIVNPDFQNQGIGKLLMAEIERQFANADNFELFTGSKSMKNISLYQKIGFKIFKKEQINQKLEFVYFRKGKRET
jgi:ribosomal protein S18 acetylase RimI-like enzyme